MMASGMGYLTHTNKDVNEMNNLSEIRKKIADLKKQELNILQKEKQNAITEVKQYIADFGLSAKDIGLTGVQTKKAVKTATSKKKTKKTVAKIKYQRGTDKWSGGRGPKPKWVKEIISAGQDIEQYRVIGS
jgi:DNA-binding protein H-NS